MSLFLNKKVPMFAILLYYLTKGHNERMNEQNSFISIHNIWCNQNNKLSRNMFKQQKKVYSCLITCVMINKLNHTSYFKLLYLDHPVLRFF